jgi:hypothetical protein
MVVSGLTKREYAAVAILSGLAAREDFHTHGYTTQAAIAAAAADALFIQLEK